MRRVERHDEQDARNETRRGQREHPSAKDVAKLLEVDGLGVEVHQRHAHDGAREALRRGNGETLSGGQEDRNGGAQLHGETSCRGQLRDLVAERADNLETKAPETETQEETGDRENPGGGVNLVDAVLVTDLAGAPDAVGRRPGTDGVGDVVGSVRDGHHHGRGDLRICPEMLDAVVVAFGGGVDACELLGGVGDAVAADTLEEEPFDNAEETGRVDDGLALVGVDPALLGAGLGLDLADEIALLDEDVAVCVGGAGLELAGRGAGIRAVVTSLDSRVVAVLFRHDLVGAAGLGCLVVVERDAIPLAGEVQRRVVAEQQRTEGNVPCAHAAIATHETALEVGDEEDVGYQHDTGKDTKHDTGNLAAAHVQTVGSRGLDDHEERKHGTGEGEVHGNGAHGLLERVGALKNAKLERGEQNGRNASGQNGSNSPRCRHLRHGALLPCPRNLRLRGNTDTDEGTDNGLRGGDREAERSGSDEPKSGTELGARHGQQEDRGVADETLEIDDAALDGAGDAGTEGHGADKLGKHGEDTDLGHGKAGNVSIFPLSTRTITYVLAATEVAYALATSLAPLPNDEAQNAMVMRTKSHVYRSRAL